MIVDKTFRRGPVSINYITNFHELNTNKPLLVVFPSVNPTPGFCIASYFAFNNNKDFNVIHVIDNYGSHGSYFLKKGTGSDLLEILVDFLKTFVDPALKESQRVVFAGTSKGASIALMASGYFDGIHCIAGEPQIHLGSFLMNNDGFKNEACRAIAYDVLGRASLEDRSCLDTLIHDKIKSRLPEWRSHVTILVGETTGYLYWHIDHLMKDVRENELSQQYFELRIGDYSSHNDVIDVFIQTMREFGIDYVK